MICQNYSHRPVKADRRKCISPHDVLHINAVIRETPMTQATKFSAAIAIGIPIMPAPISGNQSVVPNSLSFLSRTSLAKLSSASCAPDILVVAETFDR